jgi:tRNA A-37 threonylcarbamoyl transferase component Bud32
MLEAISLIHWNNIAHYDVKIENVDVMGNGYFKLIDVGMRFSIDDDDIIILVHFSIIHSKY